MAESKGPLDGVRVIDLTTVFMGPLTTQMLADLGAEVIKVESLGGDTTRQLGPEGDKGLGPLFLGLNRNKRSIAVNLKEPAGRGIVLDLAKEADVIVSNIRPAAMRRLGLDYDSVSLCNKKIIYASLTGFSQRGRYAADPAFDDLIQAAVGLPLLIGKGDGERPKYVPITIADRLVGVYAFGIISAALLAREKSGIGQQVDIPMFETMTSIVFGDHLFGHSFVPPKGDFGYPRILSQYRRPYKTRDGYVCCVVYTDKQWKKFLDVIGKGDLMHMDDRFKNLQSRTKYVDDLYELLDVELAKKTTREWQEALTDIPIFPVLKFEDMLSNDHLRDVEYFKIEKHPVVGVIREMAVPSEWSKTVPMRRCGAPLLGEHSRAILGELGREEEDIQQLIDAGVVGIPAAD